MINVPEQFRPHINVDYPPNNRLIFEEWFYEVTKSVHDSVPIAFKYVIENNREYLPIFWTSYYVNHNYGNDKRKLKELQDYIDNLDKSKKYFTIVQYDDGILNDLTGLDIKIFGMGGGKYDYPLPLISKPHPYSFTTQRDVFCNFMGALTHPIRHRVLQVANKYGYLTSTKQMPIQEYCFNLSRSVFTLAPRGYGVTSFRLAEAIQYGSIPVYLSDAPMIPHNLGFDYGVIIEPDQIPSIDRILKSVDVAKKQAMLPDVYNELFTYEGCKNLLLKHIS